MKLNNLIRTPIAASSIEISTEWTALFYATDIITRATEELKRLSQNGFQESFQHLY
jgi:hypothetical protein